MSGTAKIYINISIKRLENLKRIIKKNTWNCIHFQTRRKESMLLEGKKVINFHSDAKLDYYRLKIKHCNHIEAICEKSKGRLATLMPALEGG